MGRGHQEKPTGGSRSALSNLPFRRSNSLILSRNSNTLTEDKLLDYAIYVSQKKTKETGQQCRTVEFTLSEICQYEGAVYSTFVKTLALIQKGKSINKDITVPDDEDPKGFHQFPLYNRFSYKRGQISVEFNEDAMSHLYDLRRYTSGYANINMLFSKASANSLYDLLCLDEYRLRKPGTTKVTDIIYNIYDLRERILPKPDNYDALVDKMLAAKGGKNFTSEEFYEKYGDQMPYPSFGAFKRSVLDVAVKEINDLAFTHPNMFCVEYEQIKAGTGGKTIGISFSIYYPKMVNTGVNRIETEEGVEIETPEFHFSKEAIVDVMNVFVNNEKLSQNDYKSLLTAANGSIEKIQKAYDLMCQQSHVGNIVGWMIQCIKKEFWDNLPQSHDKGLTADESMQIDELLESLGEEFSDVYEAPEEDMNVPGQLSFENLEQEDTEEAGSFSTEDILNMLENDDVKQFLIDRKHYNIEVDESNIIDQSNVKDIVYLINEEVFDKPIKTKLLLRYLKHTNYNLSEILDMLDNIRQNDLDPEGTLLDHMK